MKSIFRKIIKGIDAAARFDIPIVTQIDAVIDMITSGDAIGATKEAEKVRDEITAIGTTHERRAVLRARLGTAGVAFLAPVKSLDPESVVRKPISLKSLDPESAVRKSERKGPKN
jgi:hypothetical protein